MATEQTKGFGENYAKLRNAVEKLRTSNIDNVDGLMQDVEEVTQAYRECKARIENIRAMVSKVE